MTCQTRRLTSAALALAALLPAGIAAAQSVPGVPPSIGQEIDRALSQVPDAHRRTTPGGPTVGQEIDQLMNRPTGQAAPARSRQVSLAFENKTDVKALVIQFTPSGASTWGPNRLGRETLNPRAWMRWRVSGPTAATTCASPSRWAQEFVRLDHDFCAQEKIEVTAVDAAAEAPGPADAGGRRAVPGGQPHRHPSSRSSASRPAGARRPQGDLLGVWMMEPGDVYTGRVPRGGPASSTCAPASTPRTPIR
jgi:hypothetical protein